jgi:hypothetical protein
MRDFTRYPEQLPDNFDKIPVRGSILSAVVHLSHLAVKTALEKKKKKVSRGGAEDEKREQPKEGRLIIITEVFSFLHLP